MSSLSMSSCLTHCAHVALQRLPWVARLRPILRVAVQADEYRHAGDNYQLYTMLMRFARCV